MNNTKAKVIVAIFSVVSLFLTWIVYVTLQRSVSGDTDTYTATFTDVSGLAVGDDVRMAGVRVGRVNSIDLVGALADVRFEVQSDHVLFGNTIVSVTYQNIIGQRYLGLSLGESDNSVPLSSGDRIPVDRTNPSFDISALLNGFEPLFTTLEPQQVDNITTALITALQGDTGSLTTLIAETSTLTEQFVGPDDILGQVIQNLDALVGNLASRSADVRAAIVQTRRIFEGLSGDNLAVLDQLGSISTVAERASTVLAGAQPSLQDFIARDPGFADHFIQNKDKFAYFAWNLPPLLKGLGRFSETGQISAMVCDATVSLVPGLESLIPTIVSAATPGGVPQHSTKCR